MSILDEPMFPQMTAPCPACNVQLALAPGKSARVYAAIHLCVPESGDAELDAMIRKAQRQRVAEMAMNGLCMGCAGPLGREFSAYAKGSCNAVIADRAVVLADAVLAELEKKL